MPNQSLGLGTSIGGGLTSSYTKDGLKLYMPYSSPKEVKFVGEGSTLFNGSTQYVDLGLQTTSGTDATVSAWIYTLDANVNDILRFGDMMVRMGSATVLYVYPDGGGGANYITVPSVLNKWVHICITIKGTLVTYYYNGELVGTDTSSDGLSASSVTSYIGRYDTDYFKGSIKNVALWNRALSATEVQNVMHKTYDDLSGTLTSGLVSWWALESDYLDKHGDNEGTATNTPTQTTSLYGGATPLIPRGFDNAKTVQADAIGTGYAVFDAPNEHINIEDDSSLDFGTADFSLCFWAKSVSLEQDCLLSKRESSTLGWAFFLWNGAATGDSVSFVIDDNSAAIVVNSGDNTFTENTWHHIAIVADRNDTMKLYIDGILKNTSASISGIGTLSSSAPFAIGASRTESGTVTSSFDGYMKNIGAWTGLLTQPQIQSIMEKTYSELTASEKTSLVSWWGLDSTEGDTPLVVKDEHNTALGSELITRFTNWHDPADVTVTTDASTNTVTVQALDSSCSSVTYLSDSVGQGLCASNLPSGAYKVTFTASWTSAPNGKQIRWYYDGSNYNAHTITEGLNTFYGYTVTANGNTHINLSFSNAVQNITLSNVTVKKLSGNYGELK